MKKIIPILLLFIVTGCSGTSTKQEELPFSTVNATYSKIPKGVLTTEYEELVKGDNLYLFTIEVTVKDNEFIENFEMNALSQTESLYEVEVLENSGETIDKYFNDRVEFTENQHFIKTYVLINPDNEITNEVKSVSINYDNIQADVDIGVYITLGELN